MDEPTNPLAYNPLGLPDELMHLWSPMHLAMADAAYVKQKFEPYPHIVLINEKLVQVALSQIMRLMINVPAQHGKTKLGSVYFGSWILLLWPHMRILCLGYAQEYVEGQIGALVRNVIARWGKTVGVKLRRDTSSKAFWRVEGPGGEEGSMRCSGIGGQVAGYPADVLIGDDLVSNEVQARNRETLNNIYSFVQGSVFNRLRTDTRASFIGTRWSKWDPFGRLLADAAVTGELWEVIKIPLLAEEGTDDPLGRQPGEVLCPELLSLERAIAEKQVSMWFPASRQQHPIEDEGVHFKPATWPTFTDVGNAWQLPRGTGRELVSKLDCIIQVCVDWATTDKKHGDYTAIGVFAILSDGRMLVLEIINKRTRVEECAPLLDQVCRKWRPSRGAHEANPAIATLLANECRRFQAIPELRALKAGIQSKMDRAGTAIAMGQNGRIYFPDLGAQTLLKAEGFGMTWVEQSFDQLQSFTGVVNQGHDDIVDVFGYASKIAEEHRGMMGAASEPVVLVGGKEGVEGWW